ncbi:MAG TPA: molybdopterin-dependent oxidoreductase, partial [Stellaceae bacterium]|nr:molybdopterin-dependent oxidoreductase [Stellaceae bacterium]
DLCLLIGTEPRREAAIINARLRKRWMQGKFKVGAIGPALDLTYPVTMLGSGPDALDALISGSHSWSETLRAAKAPMLILGQGALRRRDGAAILARARKLAETYGFVREGWNGFNVLHTAAARVGGLDLGFVPGQGGRDVAGMLDGASKGEMDVIYLLGADEIDTRRLGVTTFVIYQGHHGDAGAHRADVILPGAAYTEKDATYVNTEGRVQQVRRAVFPPGDAREDWKILRALSESLGRKLPYDSLGQLRKRLAEVNAVFGHVDAVTPASWGSFGKDGAVEAQPFSYPISDFYRTDPISRASPTMKACADAAAARQAPAVKTGTHA